MSTMTNKVMKFIQKQIKDAQGNLKDMDAKRAEYMKEGTGKNFAYWAEWNLVGYIKDEYRLAEWKSMEAGVDRWMAEGRDDDYIITWLEGCKGYFVDLVMRGYTRNSTNPVSNLIEAEKINVARSIAGTSSCDSGSLRELLSGLRRD